MGQMYPVGYGLSAIVGLSEAQVAKLVDAENTGPQAASRSVPDVVSHHRFRTKDSICFFLNNLASVD